MPLGMIGKKLGMTQVYDENGSVVPVTVVMAGPCQILEVKKQDKAGYSAVKLGFDEKVKNINRAEKGYFASVSKTADKKITPKRIQKEFRVEDTSSYKAGDVLNADLFAKDEMIDVIGISKGKGFQGVIKRYGFSGGPATHGSKFHRRPGAIGAHTFPGRVWKGQQMPGHMGNEQITVKNLKVFQVDAENNLLLIKGAIPGPNTGIVFIKKK